MTIAAVAGPSGKDGISSGNGRHEVIWVEEVGELEAYRGADLFMDLAFVHDAERIAQLSRLLPSPVIVDAVVHTVSEIGQPFIRINGWPGCMERGVHELAVADERSGSVVAELYGRLGWQYRIVPDIAGMVSCRILAAIINEAFYTLQDEVSTREGIDAAMRLGTNYPYGPFEWASRIGEERVHHLLSVLSETNQRYLPARALVEAVSKIKI